MQRKYAKQIRRAKLENLRVTWIMVPAASWISVLSSLDLGVLSTLRAVGFLPSKLIRTVISPNLKLDGSVGVFRISMDGSNELILPLLRGMVSVSSVSRLPVLLGICCVWTLKLRSFTGNTTIYSAGLSLFNFLVT